MLDPIGCLTDKQERIPIEGTFHMNNYEMKCKLGSDGFMSLEYAGCLIQNRIIYPGGIFESGTNWFGCIKEGTFLVQQISGCIFQGKQLQLREKSRDADTIYECREKNGNPLMIQVGGISAADSREYLIGETFSDDKFLYVCTAETNKSKRKVIGCMFNGKQLYDGHIYHLGEVIMRCELNERGAKHSPAGCVMKDYETNSEIEKVIGCVWIEGPNPQKFTMVCQQKNETTIKNKINCLYEPGYVLEPGCFRQIGQNGIGCKKGLNGLEYVTFDSTRLDIAYQHGLQLC